MKVTVKKIAELAGVSRGTVDRVLNHRPNVNPEIRDKILSIAATLNYTPNKAARALARSSKPITLGVIMPPRDITFFDDIRRGIEAAESELKDYGIKIEYRNVGNESANPCIAAIDELLELGCDGLGLSVLDDERVRDKINDISHKDSSKRDIPVVTFNSDVTNCSRLCFVGQDLYKSGRIAAGLMSKMVRPGSDVLAVTGSMKFHAHRLRIEGFADRLKELETNISVVSVVESYDRYSDTFEGMLKALKACPEIQGVYMAAGDIKACIDAIKIHSSGQKLYMVCNDLLPQIQYFLKEGLIDFTICQDPFSQGYQTIKILFDHIFNGIKPENEFYFTDINIKTVESL